MARRREFVAACGAAVLGGCMAPSTPADGDATGIDVDGSVAWRMGGNGPTNAGFAPTDGPGEMPDRIWDVPVEGVFTLPGPVYRDGTLFVGSGAVVYAIDATAGTPAWTRRLDHLTHHYSPAIADERLFVAARTIRGARTGGGNGGFYALSIDDGTVDWQIDAPVSSGPTVADGTVYVTASSDRGTVHARDPSGTERWTWAHSPADGRESTAFGAPAVVDDVVFVTVTTHRDADANGGYLYALDRADGSPRWRFGVDAELRAAPLVGGSDGRGRVAYVAAADGTVHAVAGRTGEELWSHRVGSEVLSRPAMDAAAIYLLAAGDVIAVDRADGSERWRTDIGVSRMNGLSVTRNRVYVGGSNLTALAVADGSLRWTYPVPGEGGAYGAPVALDGVVFAGACIKADRRSKYDDHLFALS